MAEIIKRQDHRREFIDTLIELAEKDDKIVLIVPDVGFNYIEKFKEKFPKRFYNLGVTEQSTIIIAAALALDGWKPYVYSMINFVLFRPGEMVRNAIVAHKANVKLLGVAGGPSYKFLGTGHNLLHPEEDTKFCDNIGLDWAIPIDGSVKEYPDQVRRCILHIYTQNKPWYIRL